MSHIYKSYKNSLGSWLSVGNKKSLRYLISKYAIIELVYTLFIWFTRSSAESSLFFCLLVPTPIMILSIILSARFTMASCPMVKGLNEPVNIPVVMFLSWLSRRIILYLKRCKSTAFKKSFRPLLFYFLRLAYQTYAIVEIERIHHVKFRERRMRLWKRIWSYLRFYTFMI